MATTPEEPAKRSPIIRFGLYFFAVLLVCAAPFAGYAAVESFMDARDSLHWPTTEGTVFQASVEESRSGRKVSYKARLKYRYQVDGRSYTGDDVSAHDVGYRDHATAQAIADRYAVNSKPQVHYNPSDPSRALLEPGVSWRAYLTLSAPLVMLVLGVVLYWAARAMRRPRTT